MYSLSLRGVLLRVALTILLVAVEISFQQQVRIDVCAMDGPKITAFLNCAMDQAPESTRQKWEKTKELFKGQPPDIAIQKMCANAPSTGVAVINGFINQQTKADKPKLKKILLECHKSI